MTTITPEVDALEADSEVVTLETGEHVAILRLRTRQLFRLLKILTTGAGGALGMLTFDSDDMNALVTQLVGLTVVAIPRAEEETIQFIQSMVEPADLVTPAKTKNDKAKNEQLREQLDAALENPALEDLFSILEIVIRKETPEIAALGKRLAALLTSQSQANRGSQESQNAS